MSESLDQLPPESRHTWPFPFTCKHCRAKCPWPGARGWCISQCYISQTVKRPFQNIWRKELSHGAVSLTDCLIDTSLRTNWQNMKQTKHTREIKFEIVKIYSAHKLMSTGVRGDRFQSLFHCASGYQAMPDWSSIGYDFKSHPPDRNWGLLRCSMKPIVYISWILWFSFCFLSDGLGGNA